MEVGEWRTAKKRIKNKNPNTRTNGVGGYIIMITYQYQDHHSQTFLAKSGGVISWGSDSRSLCICNIEIHVTNGTSPEVQLILILLGRRNHQEKRQHTHGRDGKFSTECHLETNARYPRKLSRKNDTEGRREHCNLKAHT